MSVELLDLHRSDDAHTSKRLAEEMVIWFGSSRPDGRPHQVPVWFSWADPEIVVFSTPTAQKVHNIRRQASVALHLDTAGHGGDIVLVEGTATPAEKEAVAHLAAGFAEKYAPTLGPSGLSSWQATFSQPVLITATRIVAWTRTNGELAYRSVPLATPQG
jgi:PPOX class probable F420-dependent enzyme